MEFRRIEKNHTEEKMIKKPLNVFALAALVIFFQGCAGQKAIQSGRWTASTSFGTLEFIVSSGGNSISEIRLIFSDWHYAALLEFAWYPPSGFGINNRKFTIIIDLVSLRQHHEYPEDIYTISGEFADNGREAEGTWEEDLNGSHYSGNWEAEWTGSSSSLFF